MTVNTGELVALHYLKSIHVSLVYLVLRRVATFEVLAIDLMAIIIGNTRSCKGPRGSHLAHSIDKNRKDGFWPDKKETFFPIISI